MQAEILMIGTELLLGQIVDTNSAYLGRALAEQGIPLFQKTTVGDNKARIVAALDAALCRSDVVLCSGGLGPTEDDITRECVAEVTGRPLTFREDLFATLKERFAQANRPMTENNKRQACAPQGAAALPNPNGTAPGILVEDDRGDIACMPGVPRELYPMLDNQIIPFLRQKYELSGGVYVRVLKVCGLGESRVDQAIADLIIKGENPKIGLLASPDATRIRISAHHETREGAEALIAPIEQEIRGRLPGLIMGSDEDTLESVVDGLMAERGWKLALGETVTGGLLGARFVAAAAKQFAGGVVEPPVEKDPAGVAEDLLRHVRGAFDADCALAMAYDPVTRKAVIRFDSPAGPASWQTTVRRIDDLNQLRTATIALEYMRRWFLGVKDPTTDPKAG